MAKAKKHTYASYPKEADGRSGCKVGWLYYETEAEAMEAAKAAKHNAQIQWSLGYDFGYCVPGFIRRPEEVQKYNRAPSGKALWEVCIP